MDHVVDVAERNGWAVQATSVAGVYTAVKEEAAGGGQLRDLGVGLQARRLAQRAPQPLGVVGRDGGYTARVADACVVIPPINPNTITPHAEAFQGVVWHLMVSDPRVMTMSNKWEGLTAAGHGAAAQA